MQNEELISAEDFCNHHKIAISFISSLQQYGLIEVTAVEQSSYIPVDQMRRLEQMVRLHYDLQINLEGIDAITNLLDRLEMIQQELSTAKQRLRFYEDLQ